LSDPADAEHLISEIGIIEESILQAQEQVKKHSVQEQITKARLNKALKANIAQA